MLKDFLDEMGRDALAVGIGDRLSIPASLHVTMLASTVRSFEAEFPESSNQFFARAGSYIRHGRVSKGIPLQGVQLP